MLNQNDDYAMCRDFRHAWAPYAVEPATVGSMRGYRQRVRCSRCSTIRTRILDHRGYVIGHPFYTYPDGYLSQHGRLTESDRAAIRLAGLGVPLLRVVS